jgi:hypothetical protein
MDRRMLPVWAGAVVLLAAAGCTLDAFRLDIFGTAPHHQHVLGGNPDAIALYVQTTLQGMNVLVTSTRDKDVVRLVGTTRSGKPFEMLLKRQTSAGREQTQLQLRWQKDPDPGFWMDFMYAIQNRPVQTQSPPPGYNPGQQPTTPTTYGPGLPMR